MGAAAAWGEVMKQVRYCGLYRESDALAALAEKDLKVSELVRSVGWWRICGANSAQLAVEREWFCRMYEQGVI